MSTDFWVISCVAAFGTAILSGLGLGSAGLFVLYLTFVAGYPQTQAQELNLLFFLFSAGTALLFHARHRTVPRPFVLFLLACAIPGSLAGAWLLNVLELSVIRKLFGGMLIVTALPSLVKRHDLSKHLRLSEKS